MSADGRAAGVVLFLTQGASLATWEEAGILERELAIYRSLAPRVGRVAIMSYGLPGEEVPRSEDLEVLPNRLGLPPALYARTMAFAHPRTLARAGVLKSNQVAGGLAALRAARFYGRPFVARCGYLWSEFAERSDGAGSRRHRRAEQYERRLFRGADVVTVTTPRLKQQVSERYDIPRGRVSVIPNYVDTDLFAPRSGPRKARTLVFVGRLSPQKNVPALLDALAGVAGASLTIVGDGPDRGTLERQAGRLGVDVRFAGRVPHRELPAIFNATEAMVLPSLYEGHPKVALEALACGLPVLGTDVPGIREVIRHDETGLLCGPDVAGLRAGIETMLGDEGLRARLGAAGTEVANEFSLHRVTALELDQLEAARRHHAG